MAAILSHEQARAFYDRFGARQDSQAFYEDPATADMIAHADFARARAVFEFGCGTGRFAATLLADHLAADCTYLGVDISPTMIGLAEARIDPWREHAQVKGTSGRARLDEADASFDRLVSNYVLDLLGEGDIGLLLAEAHRVLAPDGLLCLAGLTHGRTPLGRVVSWAWKRIHARRPALFGGCRPIRVLDYATPGHWRVRHHTVLTCYGITSEVLVASRL